MNKNDILYDINKVTIIVRVSLMIAVVLLATAFTLFKNEISSTLTMQNEPTTAAAVRPEQEDFEDQPAQPKETNFKASMRSKEQTDANNIISANRLKALALPVTNKVLNKRNFSSKHEGSNVAEPEPKHSSLIGSGGEVELAFNVDIGAINENILLKLLQNNELILVLIDSNGDAIKQGNFVNVSSISDASFKEINIPTISKLSQRISHSSLVRMVKHQSFLLKDPLEGWLFLSNKLASDLQSRTNGSSTNIYRPKIVGGRVRWSTDI